jgi:hypothetical protein
MIGNLFHRRRSRVSRLLDAPLEGIGRVRESLPSAILADVLSDLAARTGIEFGDVADRLIERVGEAVARAGAEAETLADTDRGRQIRDLAARAGERAEVAYRVGADRLLEAVPERRPRSHRGLILLSAGIGLAIGGAIAYFVLARPAERRPEERTADTPSEETGNSTEPGSAALTGQSQQRAVAHPPAQGFFDQLSQRLGRARRAARTAQLATERRLWREYRAGGTTEE